MLGVQWRALGKLAVAMAIAELNEPTEVQNPHLTEFPIFVGKGPHKGLEKDSCPRRNLKVVPGRVLLLSTGMKI